MLTMATASDKDRFSDLTDDLLKHVLSFLPPDEALQTCVLDTRWRDLWRRTTSLVLMFEDERSRFPFSESTKKLAKLLIRVRGNLPLLKCQIDTYPDDEVVKQGQWTYRHTKLLIDYAITCQVAELVVRTGNIEYDPLVFDVPLISQHLKSVELECVDLEFSALNFSGCPVLEDLKMIDCHIYAREISSKSLRLLCITGCCSVPGGFHIRICAPGLISLQLDDFHGLTPFLENMPFLFICRWDLKWCPIFDKLKTLLLNEWFTAIDLACILQHTPILEMLTLQLGNTEQLARATGAQETIEQSFVCAHLKVVNIECRKVDEGIFKNLKILSTCGILREQISIKDPCTSSDYFSFQKPPHSFNCGPSCCSSHH